MHISPMFVPGDLIYDNSTLPQIMARQLEGGKPLYETPIAWSMNVFIYALFSLLYVLIVFY